MSLRTALAIASIALGGCTSQTFIGDVDFLTRHTEVLIIQPERTSNARIAICPALQGRVMTSAAAGEGGISYGWINRDLIDSGEKEVDAAFIGEKVMPLLRAKDEVAYVRFASVYRSFRDVESFQAELADLLAK